jgi:SAM-dependent methyltransferase
MRALLLTTALALAACRAMAPSSPPSEPPHAAPDPAAAPTAEGVGPAGPVPHRLHDPRPAPGHGAGHGGHDGGHGMPHRFDDAARWAASFDAPERDAWQRPSEVVAALVGGRQDLVVADIGAGTGYFSVRFAAAVPAGQVIAVDVERTLLDWVARRAREAALPNLTTHLGGESGPAWRPELPKIDLAFSCNTYHHIADRPRYFAEVRAALADGGQLAIVDFTPESPRGPPRAHRVPAEAVIAELASVGFRLASRLALLPDQYLLVFE